MATRAGQLAMVFMAAGLLIVAAASVATAASAAAAEPAPKASEPKADADATAVVVTGTIEVKDKKPFLTVQEAKGADGSPIANVKGAVLEVTGSKAADAAKHSGKTVEVKGAVKDGRSIQATAVTAK